MVQDPWIVRRAEEWLSDLGLGCDAPELTIRSMWIEILVDVQHARPLPRTLSELLGRLEASSLSRSQAGRVLTETVRTKLTRNGDVAIPQLDGAG